MPLARYFSYVSGVLLALLFILDACFPQFPAVAKAKGNLPVIHIYSDRKLPERLVYDTNLSTIVPTSIASREITIHAPERIVDASVGAKEREALAMLPPSGEQLQASDKKMRTLRPRHQSKIVRKREPAPRVAMARHQQFDWFGRSFW